MKNIPLQSFLNRVVTSQERVQFSAVDPYGHLNASRYLEMILNHRVLACEDQLQCFTMDIAKQLGQGFVIYRVDLRYLRPSFLSETLEVASWLNKVEKDGFTLTVAISGGKSSSVRIAGHIVFKSVSLATGRAIELAAELPSRSEEELILERPLSAEYVGKLKGFPEELMS